MKIFNLYKKILIMLAFSAFALISHAQNSVSGRVTDEKGQPLSGASITIKGNKSGAKTDDNGNYSILKVPNKAVLIASYVGFANEEVVVTSSTVNFVLKVADRQLDELIVVGYGSKKKSLVTGAIASLRPKDLENKQITRADDALQGLTAGVTVVQSSGAPGAAPMVRVRGVTSINVSDPLYIVDGVVINGITNQEGKVNGSGIDYLNPNDIATIEVLKDAASCAIYGARAANGVILINTKKGAFGAKTTVSYNGQVGWQAPIKTVGLTNAIQYARISNQILQSDNPTAPLLFPNPEQYGTGTNWQNEMFAKGAPYQSHNINVQGGTDKSTYYLSLGYIGQSGIISPSTAFNKKINLTTNTSFKIGNYVTIGEDLNYTYQKYNIAQSNDIYNGPINQILNIDPITPVYTTDTAGYNEYAVRTEDGRYFGISKTVQNDAVNPVAYQEIHKGDYSWAHNLVGNAYIKINPIKNVNIRSQFGVKQSFWGNTYYTPLYYLNSNHKNVAVTTHYREIDQNLTWNWDNTVSYENTIGQHHFSVLFGASTQALNGYGANISYLDEPAASYKDASYNFRGVSKENKQGEGYDIQPYRQSSLFARLSYNYAEKYLFEGIVRKDGSSRFGSDNKYATFPSVQLGWVLSKESFFPKTDAINNVKLRASYGVVGNDMSLKDFVYLSTIDNGTWNNYIFGNDEFAAGYTTNLPANPNLKWEQTESFDIGFDALLFKNFNVTFDYYNKKTTGMLQQLPIPTFSGYYQNGYSNVGNLVNRGAELSVAYKKTFNNDFKLDVQGNVSYLHNEVTFLGKGISFIDGDTRFQNSSYPLSRTALGQQVNAFYGFKELGIFKNQAEINNYGYTNKEGAFHQYQPNAQPGDIKWWKNPKNPDDNGEGEIGMGDRVFIGNPIPSWTYGLNINMAWKGFDVLLFGQGSWGNKIFQQYRRLDISNANYPIEALQALNAWDGTNYNSNYPRLTSSDLNGNLSYPSTFHLQNGAYFRLKTAQMGYTLQQKALNVIGVKKIRVYGSVSNLFTITKYTGFDPEISTGIDLAMYPRAKTYLLGLNVTF